MPDHLSDLAPMLLAGPRGRRMLMEFAAVSEGLAGRDEASDSFCSAVFFAAYALDPGKGTSRVMFGPGAEEASAIEISPAQVAERLARVPLAEVTPELLCEALGAAVDSARYWQEPDGDDVLAASAPVRTALTRVAEHLAVSPHTRWWQQPLHREQWLIAFEGEPTLPNDTQALLTEAHRADLVAEREAVRERPADPTANVSDQWWSTPARDCATSTRALPDGSPGGLWFVEDGFGWDWGRVAPLGVPADARVFEIDSADAWARLCTEFPCEETAQKRHDWYRTTGRDGRWITPDWSAVAEQVDAVHLQVAAYLAAAGTAIPVGPDTASVIAGWNPDETYWFTPRIRLFDPAVTWQFHDKTGWQRA